MSKWPINMKIKPTSLGNPENTSQNHSDVPLHAPYSGKILKGWKQYKMVADLISSHGHLIYSHIWNNFLLKGPLKAARQLLPIRKKKRRSSTWKQKKRLGHNLTIKHSLPPSLQPPNGQEGAHTPGTSSRGA